MFDASTLLPELSTGWQADGMSSRSDPHARPGQLLREAASNREPARFAFGLSQADVEEFRELIHRDCGEELSAEEAWQRASEVLALFRMLLGPHPEDRTGATYPQGYALTDSQMDGINE